MGIIIDCKTTSKKFKELVENQKYFVDKSGLINIFNKALVENGGNNYISITKPRRFGKSFIASMLVSYYSKSIDSKGLFDNLKVYKEIAPLDDTKKTKETSPPKVNDEQKDSDKNIFIEQENSRDKISNEKNFKEQEDSIKEISDKKKERPLALKRYEEFQKKFHTLYFDFSEHVDSFIEFDDYLDFINQTLKEDIEELYPDSNLLNKYSKNICINLERLNNEIDVDFVIIIDEWDYIIANRKFSFNDQGRYFSFLKDLIKGKGYARFVYMTGILPLEKQLKQSTLNCFKEYSMLKDKKYYNYFGFTKQEVQDLCRKNSTLQYEDLEKWYNGYKNCKGEPIFNPWSVIQALSDNCIDNYWPQTGSFDEIVNMVNFKINGVEKDIIELIRGKELSINLDQYSVDNLMKELKNNKKNNINKKELYSKMVTYGFLTYYDGKLSIPNLELLESFVKGLRKQNDKLSFLNDLIENSKKTLQATLDKDAKAVCELFKEAHRKKIIPGDKFDHGVLKRVVDMAYFYGLNDYNIKKEVVEGAEGAKRAVFFFYPRNNKNETVIILELKRDETVESTTEQIHNGHYSLDLKEKGYTGNVLLVRVNCKKKYREYSCIIEECNSDGKVIATFDYKSSTNKRKTTPTSDNSDNIKKKFKKK
ncbi:hypothetical protein PIROE2DRAFT_13944 [Piromyces sp. E2]|nr:hypothetical protein PIROE2DRAFT_13944 [Piromyces sp. E2]|eukprot:OUM60326.1 hypothetical protein PIROE2DRAFT_13944 [Piromyces sp. E2]